MLKLGSAELLRYDLAVHRQAATLQRLTYAHISSDQFLHLLPGEQVFHDNGRTLQLNTPSLNLFKFFNVHVKTLCVAVAELTKSRRKKGELDEDWSV